MSLRFQSPSLPVFLSPEPVDGGSVTHSSCSLNELGNISHLLRKISADVNEIKGMKAAILTVEANLFDLNVKVSQNEAKISSLEVKMNGYSASASECNRHMEDFHTEIDFESQSRGTDVKIIDLLRNTEKGKLFMSSRYSSFDLCLSMCLNCSSDPGTANHREVKFHGFGLCMI